MEFDDTPKRRKIQDFFPEEKPRPKRKTRIEETRQKRHKVDTYLDDADWEALRAYCYDVDEKPSVLLRRLVRKFLEEQRKER